MDMSSKRRAVVPNEALVPSCRLLSSKDEERRSCLENPLSAATKAMISINGDEDSAVALGLLYDYCKLSPREMKPTSRGVKTTDPATLELDSCGSLEILDHHLQALSSMPVNLSLNNATTEGQDSKREPSSLTGNGREGDTFRGRAVALVKSEGHMPMGASSSGGFYREEPRDQIGMDYDQHRYDFHLAAYLKEEHRSTSDNLYEDAVETEIYPESLSSGVEDLHYREPSGSFQYCLEASMSHRPRQGEGPMAYLNRGQFYALTLSKTCCSASLHQSRDRERMNGLKLSDGPGMKSSSELQQDSIVQSVIMIVFGEEKCRDEQLNNWKYWHSRQHTVKQRVLDIADCKESFSMIGNVEEIAYNAVSFTWDVSEDAKVFISVNCLSTDFSSQKGVKGMPLLIQIDTYSYNSCSSRPIHRAVAQIKVFCDKGAERKLRDEEKKQLRKRMKGKNSKSGVTFPVRRADHTLLKTVMDLDSHQPVLFIPNVYFGNLQRAGQVFAVNTEEVSRDRSAVIKMTSQPAEKDVCPPQSKRPKVELERKVLLYVRKECDDVFDALMLHTSTLRALTEAISEKYGLALRKIDKVYQKSKKGVLVNLDDNMIQQYSNEDTFILAVVGSADSLHIILSEI